MRMMNEFEAQVLSDLSVLKTQMNGLMGHGNGGRSPNSNTAWSATNRTGSVPKEFLAAFSVLLAVAEIAAESWHPH